MKTVRGWVVGARGTDEIPSGDEKSLVRKTKAGDPVRFLALYSVARATEESVKQERARRQSVDGEGAGLLLMAMGGGQLSLPHPPSCRPCQAPGHQLPNLHLFLQWDSRVHSLSQNPTELRAPVFDGFKASSGSSKLAPPIPGR